jgi:hypothetical protein
MRGWVHFDGIRDVDSLFNEEFHKEGIWACLDIVDKTRKPSSWHLIGF